MARIGLDLRFWRSSTGGVGRYSRNLLAELLKLDPVNEYTAIITPADEPEFSLQADNLTKRIVPIAHYSLSEQTKFAGVLNGSNFDLVHFAQFNHPLLYRRPFVITIHDITMHYYPSGSQKNSWSRRLAYKKIMADCRRAKRILVPSESTKSDLVGVLGIQPAKVVITPEGVESTYQPASPDKVVELKKRLGLPERYLLFVSRWERYKGLSVLLDAHKQLGREFPELGLVIAGKPDRQNPEVANAVAEAQRAGLKVVTPGFVAEEDLPTLYSAASVYVLPSLYEGFGLMVLEAFASGVPVVTSNVSSLPEVAGDAALLVDPRNPDEIAGAIKSILTDKVLAESLRQKGLERVKQFSWRKMAEQTLEVYRQVLKSGSVRP